MIRICTTEDIPDLLEMGKKFCELSERPFNEDSLITTFNNLINDGVLLRSEKGCIGGIIYPLFMSGEMVAQEIFWWSEDKQGRALLEQFESIAKDSGAKYVMMVSLAKSSYNRICDIYKKLDYELLESNYIKRV